MGPTVRSQPEESNRIPSQVPAPLPVSISTILRRPRYRRGVRDERDRLRDRYRRAGLGISPGSTGSPFVGTTAGGAGTGGFKGSINCFLYPAQCAWVARVNANPGTMNTITTLPLPSCTDLNATNAPTIKHAHARPPESIPLCQGDRSMSTDQEGGSTKAAIRNRFW